jgi:hypothetical protein
MPYNQALGDRLVLISLCQDLGMWLGGGAVMALAHRGWSLLGARRTANGQKTRIHEFSGVCRAIRRLRECHCPG